MRRQNQNPFVACRSLCHLVAVAMILIGGQIVPVKATTKSANFAVTATVIEQCAVVVHARLETTGPQCRSGAGAGLASTATVTLAPNPASSLTLLTFTF